MASNHSDELKGQRVELEKTLKIQMQQLNERVKELNCLYSVAALGEPQMTLPDLLQRIIELIPPAWQYSEITCARLSVFNQSYLTANFQETLSRMSSSISVREEDAGSIEVFYLASRPEAYEGPFLKEERNLLDALADLIGQIIERKIAEDDLRSLAADLSLAEQRERFRIAGHLHDEVSQPLAMLKIKLGSIRQTISSEEVVREIDITRDLVDQTIRSIRGLSFDLAPPILYDLGFEAAVESQLEKLEERHEITTRFSTDSAPHPLPPGIQILLYTMVREILINAIKHSGCKNLGVSIRSDEHKLSITVEDDGIGFDFKALEKDPKKDGGFGLFSIRERIRHLGGKMSIDSRMGKGSSVTLSIPIEDK